MKKLTHLLCSARSMTAVLAILLTGCITYPAHAQSSGPVRVVNSTIVYPDPDRFWSSNALAHLNWLISVGVKTNAASAGANGWLSSNDWQAFNAKQAALGYTPATNTLAGILAAMGYTPPTNSNAGITLALGFNAATNTLAGIAAALGYTPATNSNAGIVAALGYTPMPASLTLSNLMATGAFTNGLVAGTGITFTTNGTTGEITIASTAGAGGAADSLNPNPQLNGTWSTALGANYFAIGTTNVNGNLQLMGPTRMYFQATTPGAGLHTGGTFGFYTYAAWISNTLNMVAGSTISGTAFMPEVGLSLSDNTTGNASTVKHGFLPKLDGNSSHVLLGDGTWGAGGGSSTWTSDHDASGYDLLNGGVINAALFAGAVDGSLDAPAHTVIIGGVSVENMITNAIGYALTNGGNTISAAGVNIGGTDIQQLMTNTVNALTASPTNFISRYLNAKNPYSATNFDLDLSSSTNFVPILATNAVTLLWTNPPSGLLGYKEVKITAIAAAWPVLVPTNRGILLPTNSWVVTGTFWSNSLPAGKVMRVAADSDGTDVRTNINWNGIVQP